MENKSVPFLALRSVRRIAAVAAKEIRQLARDRLTAGMIVGIPLIQIVIFGYSINYDVRDLRAGHVDEAMTSASRALLQDLEATQVLRFAAAYASANDLERAIADGHVRIGIVVPHDFERRRQERARPAFQVLVDGSQPSLEGIAEGLAQWSGSARHGLQPRASAPRRAALRILYNPERRTAVQIVPSLTGLILNLTMVLFTAVALVRERERGNLEWLITTPVSPRELMIGKLLPYVVVGLLQTTVILLAGFNLFSIALQGSLLDFYLAAALFIAATLMMGLTISTFAKTQFQAMQVSFLTLLPSILLSGFMFPFDGMPRIVQWFAQIMPLTHFVEISRAIVLRGATLGDLGAPLLKLTAFIVIAMAIALARFRKRLD